jgi:aminoglycoside phosphotransferase (APT) family kinase protein
MGQDEASKSFVMEYLAGDHVVWKAELMAGRVDHTVAAAVADVIGQIHAATAHSPEQARRFATDDNFYAIRLEPYLGETARMHPALAPQLLALIERTRHTRLALVHGDLSPKNILVGAHGPVLLDAECAWYGDPAFDGAFLLNHLLLKSAWMPQHLTALMAAFDAFVASYFPHVKFEAPEALESRMATLLPALILARVDGKSPAEYLDDKARQRIRSVAISLLSQPVARLQDVRTFWTQEFTA